jgi:dTDP-4-amino-4,6-dideoxygalactose transaminase
MESRLWYGLGLHCQSHFANCPRDPLPVSDRLAPSLLGLPMAPDLSAAAVDRVVAAVLDQTKGD